MHKMLVKIRRLSHWSLPYLQDHAIARCFVFAPLPTQHGFY
jgi:hypothetical protein